MSKKVVVINGKNVEIKPVDFNGVCELSENGFDFESGKVKIFSSLRACLAYNMGADLVTAGKEIEEHIKGGGKIDDLLPMLEAVTDSDFFQAVLKK